MKINAKLTLLVSADRVTIEVEDATSHVRFLSLELTPEQWCMALSRRYNTPVEAAEVAGLDKLGKQHECKTFEFPMPTKRIPTYEERPKIAAKEAAKACPEGWVPDTSFSSQDSFFDRDGKPWARTMIRRWVDVADAEKEGE